MGRRHLLIVSVPNNLSLRIPTARTTRELHVLAALHGFALGVAFYIWWTGWICEGSGNMHRYTKALRANETYLKAYPDNHD